MRQSKQRQNKKASQRGGQSHEEQGGLQPRTGRRSTRASRAKGVPPFTVDSDLDEAVKYLAVLAAELRGFVLEKRDLSDLPARLDRRKVLKKVIAELLGHKWQRDQYAREARVVGLSERLLADAKEWRKQRGGGDVAAMMSQMNATLQTLSPLLELEVSPDRLRKFLLSLSPKSPKSDVYLKSKVEAFLGELSGVSQKTIQRGSRAFHGKKTVKEGALKTEQQVNALIEEYPLRVMFKAANDYWLRAWNSSDAMIAKIDAAIDEVFRESMERIRARIWDPQASQGATPSP